MNKMEAQNHDGSEDAASLKHIRVPIEGEKKAAPKEQDNKGFVPDHHVNIAPYLDGGVEFVEDMNTDNNRSERVPSVPVSPGSIKSSAGQPSTIKKSISAGTLDSATSQQNDTETLASVFDSSQFRLARKIVTNEGEKKAAPKEQDNKSFVPDHHVNIAPYLDGGIEFKEDMNTDNNRSERVPSVPASPGSIKSGASQSSTIKKSISVGTLDSATSQQNDTETLASVFDSSQFNEDVSLIYSKHEKLRMKDFISEVRGKLDVHKFLKNMVMIMDLNKTSVDEIINTILHKMLDQQETTVSFDQARSALFTHDRVHQLSKTIQCTSISQGGGFDYDQNWICALASLPAVQTGHMGIARLRYPANFGASCQEVVFVIIVLSPEKEKGTKTALETARTFSTMFSDIEFRQELYEAQSEEAFHTLLLERSTDMAKKRVDTSITNYAKTPVDEEDSKCKCRFKFGSGIYEDLKRRIPHYVSDYVDGIVGRNTIQKTFSTVLFLYFACMLPSIAFGVLNYENTAGHLTVEKVVYSQTIGGLMYAVLGGTPQVVLLTTAPLALYTFIIFSLCEQFDLDFVAMYACVGIWNAVFLVLYATTGLSVLMKWSTRSSEEIFALFISIAFAVDAFKNVAHDFDANYNSAACKNISSSVWLGESLCLRDSSMLYLLLMFGTLWMGVTLYQFKETPYLNAGKREILADYALPVAVLIMTFIGAYVFRDVHMKSFIYREHGETLSSLFTIVSLSTLPVGAVFGAMGLGFCLSLLFFMDQNISAALVNSPANKLKKGTAYHWDLLMVAVINVILSLFGFPWVHAALPHSPLHVRCLADVEERVDQGHIHQIVIRVRETRLTGIFSHILIGLSLLFLEYLRVIPNPVLYGMFLYLAVTALYDNQMFERVLLFFTEQSAYPPNHYIRSVPQRKIHLFTISQLIQLIALCAFGFAPYPYLKMFFPVLIFLLIPIRQKLIPFLIDEQYLSALDHH